jgi:hypothetical protein
MCGSEGGQTPEVRAPGPFVPVVKVAKQKHQPSWGSAEAKVNFARGELPRERATDIQAECSVGVDLAS